jgi:N-acetylglucosamine kinase-like BadF-type ATPase
VTGRRGDHIERAGGLGPHFGRRRRRLFSFRAGAPLILREHDLHRVELDFTAKILHALSLNNFDELVRWVQTADKMEIATLAPVVFETGAAGGARMMEIIEEGARVLCEYTEAVARPPALARAKGCAHRWAFLSGLNLHARVPATARRKIFLTRA